MAYKISVTLPSRPDHCQAKKREVPAGRREEICVDNLDSLQYSCQAKWPNSREASVNGGTQRRERKACRVPLS